MSRGQYRAPEFRNPMRKLSLVYFNAGGGHRASALALDAAIRELGRPWHVELVNLMEVLDPQDSFRKWTGMGPEDVYNRRLARGWTLGLAQELKLLQGMIRLAHPMLVRQLQQYWLREEPDLVVSLIPNFNRALCESLSGALPGVPYVTVLTDMADHPPNFWVEPGVPQHLVCGTPKALAQARAAGVPEARLHATSGMILRPDFYRTEVVDRSAERGALGLDPERPTGLVLFGGQGSKVMLDIAERLADVQLILMCGHNAALADRLRALPAAAPRVIVGFTPDIPRYMQLADFFIGKPGPGSISEAVQLGLPVIVVRNAWTMPQERYNAVWVRENNAGLVLPSFRRVRGAVDEMIVRLDEFRTSLARIDNRAVFEVPDILASVLSASDTPQSASPLSVLRTN